MNFSDLPVNSYFTWAHGMTTNVFRKTGPDTSTQVTSGRVLAFTGTEQLMGEGAIWYDAVYQQVRLISDAEAVEIVKRIMKGSL